MFSAFIASVALPWPPVDYGALRPIDDADLAAVHAETPVVSAPLGALQEWRPPMATSVAWEQSDNWWADDGAMLYANARRPVPVGDLALDLDWLQGPVLRIQLNLSVTASTRQP